MFEELGISTYDSVLAAFNAVCDLKEETERLQAACAAKEAELYELRSRTAELFGERLSAEGADEDAVQAAKAMWLSEPAAAAHAALGCDIVEAANPWGCNQYGHRKGHSGGVGGTDAKNREARSNLSDSDADFLTSDAYEIAMEEGGYEILYDTPKEKVKKAIRDTLKETGSASMLEGDTSALYSWWKKNKEKVVNKLKAESLQASNKHACEQERELYSAEYYDALECSHTLEELLEDEEVAAANPYGCNQYGHEWRGKHGEGWKPSGRGGNEKQGEKKEETSKDGKKRDRESVSSGIQDKKSKKIVNDAEKFFKESEEAFSKYKNDKRNPYDKVELLKQWRRKYMDFFAQYHAFSKLRNSDHYITDSDRNQVLDYFKKREEEIIKQYDVVLEEIPSFLGK